MHLPGPPAARDLARRLGDLGYSIDGIRERLGTVAADALDRNEAVPARRVLAGDQSPLVTAIRLFLLAEGVPSEQVSAAFGSLENLGDLLHASDGTVRSIFELAPCAVDMHDWLVAADWPSARTEGPLSKEHVLGVGGASTLLAQCTVRPEIQSALDIGTGCGIQSFQLWQHSSAVIATDVSPRCLTVADFNFAMNGMHVSTRHGDLFEPVERRNV